LYALDQFDCPGLQVLREQLLKSVEKYFYGADDRNHFQSIEETSYYTVATLLDARFKSKGM